MNNQLEIPQKQESNDTTSNNNCYLNEKYFQNTQQINKIVVKKLYFIIFLSALFMVLEIVGGVYANSLAIISDAFHLLSDLLGFFVSVYTTRLSQKVASKRFNFGYQRIEIIGAFVSIVFIWILSVNLSFTAIRRLYMADYEINNHYMFYASIIGLFLNMIMILILCHPFKIENCNSIHSNSTFHHHHSHNSDRTDSSKSNVNIRATTLHVMGDMLQSISILIASLVLIKFPQLKIIDPICTLVFTVILLVTTFPIIKDILNVLLETKPFEIDYTDVLNMFKSLKNVVKVHNLHIWYLTFDTYCLNVHLMVDDKSQINNILEKSYELLHKLNVSIRIITIQIEIYEYDSTNKQYLTET